MKPLKQLNRDILALVWQGLKANRFQSANNLIAGLAIVALEFLFVWATKLTIDIATGASKLFPLRDAIILLVITMILQLAVTAWRTWVNTMLSVRATNKMQLDVFGHAISASWLLLHKYHSGDVVNRIEKDVNAIVSFVTDTLPSFFVVAAQFCGAFIFLYLMDRKLSLFILIVIPFFLVLGKLYIRRIRKISRRIRDVDSRLQSQYQEGVHNNIVLKTLEGAMCTVLDKVVFTQDLLVNLVRRRAYFSITSNLVVNTGFMTAYLFTFIWGTYHLSVGMITYGTLIAFIQLVAQIQRPARGMIRFVPELISLLTSGERLLEIKKIGGENANVRDKATVSVCKPFPDDGKIGINVSGVTFGYDKNKPVIYNLSHDFKPGSRTVISAPTGRGKTTLIRLMLALFSPEKGDIRIYNRNFSHVADPSTRPLFAYVPQGNTLFSGTIRANLKLAAPDATDEELLRVLTIAKADFVEKMPQGLSSQCGEGGMSLSEGQAQRLCIARTLLKNAPVLLLDEATSALDIETEAALLHNITTNFPDTTIICISHRPKAREYFTEELRL